MNLTKAQVIRYNMLQSIKGILYKYYPNFANNDTIAEQILKNLEHQIDKEWIFEIMDKTNAFAKQLIEDHFNRNK